MLKQVEREFITRLSHLYDSQEIKEIYLLCAGEILSLPRTQVILKKNIELVNEDQSRFESFLCSLEKGIPIQHVLGYVWFYGMKLIVNEEVLIPRPETEELVALILRENRRNNPKIIDIGTGSGCIPIALKNHLPEADVWAVDVSSEALKVASENAEMENCEIHFIETDILHSDPIFLEHGFDIIVSNPPYITPSEKDDMDNNVLEHEPHLALFVSEERPLLFYEVISAFAKKHLNEGGSLYFEINRRFGKEVQLLLKELGFSAVEIHQDMYGADRMVSARI